MNAKEKLTCKYSNEIYKHPVSLNCCDETICKQDLVSNVSLNKFTCPLCNEENVNQKFNFNKLIQDLVENDLHEFEVDSKSKRMYDELQMEIKNLEKILKDPENIIYEEIYELKRQVDLDREKLKSEIDKLADGFIQQLESYEKKFKAEHKKNVDLEHYNGLVESSSKQLVEYERFLSLFSAKYKAGMEQNKKTEKIISNLQSEIVELKEKLFSNLSIKYKPINKIKKYLFGKLIIKVFLELT